LGEFWFQRKGKGLEAKDPKAPATLSNAGGVKQFPFCKNNPGIDPWLKERKIRRPPKVEKQK